MGRIGGCLLVVSPDLEILRSLTQALALKGYALTAAMDWSEAAARLRSLPITAMLYDLKDLDRREWHRLADLRRVRKDLSVILLASLESDELDRAVDEGLIAGYQVKPIRLVALEECLERVGAKRRKTGVQGRSISQ